ncbi:MAG: aldehyde dehydrogenase family protein [Burkholderiales bacterium]|nr:aldehyde dehydrogenase family protein [Burkholderiales bacterium]
MNQVAHFIAGRCVSSDRREPKRSPVDGRLLAEVCVADAALVDDAVRAATAALAEGWGRSEAAQRADLLDRIAAAIDTAHDELVGLEIDDTGKPVPIAAQEVARVADNFRSFAAVARHWRGECREIALSALGRFRHRVQRRPKGVVAAIGPWNVPLLTLSWKIAPALAWGNAVVAKPSQHTPRSALRLAQLALQAGLPPGALNVVHGGGSLLAAHAGVAAVTLTGSTDTGREVLRAAAGRIADVALELGGKNAGVVFADADFDAAVQGTLQSSFRNTGQICLATERLYVERPLYRRFVDALAEGVRRFRLGDPRDPATTHGPLISHAHRARVLAYYEQARADGAQVVVGGAVPRLGRALDDGAWIEPTVWTGLPDAAAVNQEEVFGPCVHVAPFDTEAEAVARARHPRYGLAAVLWTRDAARMERLLPQLDAGMVWVNSWLVRQLDFPFGGMKQSGLGREGGLASIDFFTDARCVVERLPEPA